MKVFRLGLFSLSILQFCDFSPLGIQLLFQLHKGTLEIIFVFNFWNGIDFLLITVYFGILLANDATSLGLNCLACLISFGCNTRHCWPCSGLQYFGGINIISQWNVILIFNLLYFFIVLKMDWENLSLESYFLLIERLPNLSFAFLCREVWNKYKTALNQWKNECISISIYFFFRFQCILLLLTLILLICWSLLVIQ